MVKEPDMLGTIEHKMKISQWNKQDEDLHDVPYQIIIDRVASGIVIVR